MKQDAQSFHNPASVGQSTRHSVPFLLIEPREQHTPHRARVNHIHHGKTLLNSSSVKLKRSSGQKALRKCSPAMLWDHCIELESILRSNMAVYHPELNGQVPETIMKGQTADISNLAKYVWYDWIVYWKKTADYPDFKECYGRWL